MDLDALTPMYIRGVEHFYVKEVARLIDGRYIIPIRWIVFKGILHCDAYRVVIDEEVRVIPSPLHILADNL
jgi:hypothetical protein